MAIANANGPATTSTGTAANYRPALAVVTTLFFMWGSLTALNDVLIPHFQHVFSIKLAVSMLVQTAFFSAYFVFSIPGAKIIDWLGYQRAMVVGLLTMGAGAFLFVPAAKGPSFGLFLAALIVLAAGITVLQVAANPYVTVLGKPETASSRLNLTQAFNSLGTVVAPWIGAHLILASAAVTAAQTPVEQAASVIKPYVGLAVTLVLLAVAIGLAKLPKIASAEHHIGQKVNDSIWKHPNLVFGAIAIFVYVGAEVAIGSSIANYLALDNIGGFVSSSSVPDATLRYQEALVSAAKYISLYWLGAMIGRFIGSAILQKVKTGYLLGLCAVMAALLVTISVLSSGPVAMWSILLVGLFNSIMFPSIFTLGVAELGPLTGDGSGIMIMAIVGGAIIPWIVGKVADLINAQSYGGAIWGQGLHRALILAAVCYLYILFFALSGSKPNSERYAKA
ncbi:MAG TPA: sugar MFS transporter [Terriglobales bacterium]|nr:sugar MFS transporter [Terriglobales bacterium]